MLDSRQGQLLETFSKWRSLDHAGMSQAHLLAGLGQFLTGLEVRPAALQAQVVAQSSDAPIVGSSLSLSTRLDLSLVTRLCSEPRAKVFGYGWESGLAIGGVLGIPWYVGQTRAATLIAACAQVGGTLEVWHVDAVKDELRLASGYFGLWDEFRRISASTSFAKGAGLPGRVWDIRKPTLFEDLTESAAFLRADAARSVGLAFGLGLPVTYSDGFGVVVLLSTMTTPVARSVDIWRLHGTSDIEHLQGLAPYTTSGDRNSLKAAAKALALASASQFVPIAVDTSSAGSTEPTYSGWAWPSRDGTGVVHVATLMS